MGILDNNTVGNTPQNEEENNNCPCNEFDRDSMETLVKYSIRPIYPCDGGEQPENPNQFQEENLQGVYEDMDWRLFQTPIDKPFEWTDSDGSTTYFWYYGDSINLDINLTGEVVVEDDAIVYTAYGQHPEETTIGVIGQKAYNVVDFISWTLVAIEDDFYIWERDQEFEQPQGGSRNFYVSVQEYIKDKEICVKIKDFRYNDIYEEHFSGSQDIRVVVDGDLSMKMVPGVYYLHLSVIDPELTYVAMSINKYRLLVK